MGNLGFQEILLIFIIALIFFGPRKLPEIGKTIGKSLAEFRKATNELRNTWEEEVRKETEGLQSTVNTNELTEAFNQNSYDNYGNSSYDDSSTSGVDTSEAGSSETSGSISTSETEYPSGDVADGYLEPNSSIPDEPATDPTTIPQSESDPDTAQREVAEGVVPAR